MSNEEQPGFDLWATARVTISDGEVVESNRFNTTLFTFIGAMATRNHIFIVREYDEETNTSSGMYIFNGCEGFDKLAEFMAYNAFPARLNLTEIAQCDENAYQNHVESMAQATPFEVPDFLPDDFN